jgi:cysteinyl-tRNA synthetase
VTVQDLVAKGYDPLALRYLYLTSHYKKGLNFSMDTLDSATVAYRKLKETLGTIKSAEASRESLSGEKLSKIESYRSMFVDSLLDDLNVAKALSIVWDVLKSNIPPGDKYDLIISFDDVLGLGLATATSQQVSAPDDVTELIDKREIFRKQGRFLEADQVRKEIEAKGFVVEDSASGIKIRYKDPQTSR